MIFEKGNNYSKGKGRPKIDEEVKETLRCASKKAAQALVKLLDSKNPKIKLQAAIEILNRNFGKPKETHELLGNKEQPLEIIVTSIPSLK